MQFAIKKYLAQEIVFLGAIGAFEAEGKGDKEICDKLAVDNIRNFLNNQKISKLFTKTGEGEMDESAMIKIDEILGDGSLEFDIAIDPLDCTSACSKGDDNSISAVCISNKNNIINCPDIYMEKLASCNIPMDVISLQNSFEENIELAAKFKNKKITDVGVIMLNRERHQDLIRIARKKNIKLFLIEEGDIMAVLKTYFEDIDFLYGIGGAPEGVISASLTSGLGGFFEGKFIFNTNEEKERAKKMNIIVDKIYTAREMVGDSSVCAICAIGNNAYLNRLKKNNIHNKNIITAELFLINSENCSIEKITHSRAIS